MTTAIRENDTTGYISEIYIVYIEFFMFIYICINIFEMYMGNEFVYSISQNKGERNCQTNFTLPIIGL